MVGARLRAWWTWQRALILGSAVLLGGFVVGVLWYVQSVPDIGLHCTFRPKVNRVDPRYLRSVDGEALPDLTDATIEEVGDRQIETWPQLHRALEGLEHADYVEIDALRAGLATPYVRFGGSEW